MRLIAYIQNYGSKEFALEVGAVYKETINETLDSFTCNIPNCYDDLDLQPYQFVRILDKDSGAFDKTFVIDNFSKEQLILNSEKNYPIFYEYKLNLMSPIKILEKVILPNRTILKSKVSTPLTIGEVMEQMCELYLPRIKRFYYRGNQPKYQYATIFNFNSVVNDEKFDVECPDLSWSNPSLREVLTTLMLYVGCLPTITNGNVLSYIDLRKDSNEFVVPTGKKLFAKYSNSSDSYINTLINPLTSVADENNEVLHEHIGFRDINNVFLKSKENLVLTTNFNIKEINNLTMHFFGAYKIQVSGVDDAFIVLQQALLPTIFKANFDIENVVVHIGSYVNELTLVNTKYIGGGFIEDRQVNIGNVSANDTFEFTNVGSFTYIITYTYQGQQHSYIEGLNEQGSQWTYYYEDFLVIDKDITSLVHESGVAKGLEVDYTLLTQFGSFDNISWDTISNNYYTAIEYRYNENTIFGFSKVYEHFEWYGGNNNYVLIDSLAKYVIAHTTDHTPYQNQIANSYYLILGTTTTMFANATFDDDAIYEFNDLDNLEVISLRDLLHYNNEVSPYGLYTFDVTYVPFNELTSRFSKDEVPLRLEQADTQENSIITFDEFSVREQQKTNRLGNNVVQIRQPQALVSELQDIGASGQYLLTYDNSTIFQREVQFYKDFCDANYVGTKNYVLRDYFTALQTKYRAYEYVDLNKSTLRKENCLVYVRVGRDYLTHATNIIYSTDYTWVSGIFANMYNKNIGRNSDKYCLTYAVENGDYYITENNITIQNGYFINDLSILTNTTSMLLSYQDLDNQEFGAYIEDTEDKTNLGGLIQTRYIMYNETYADSHITGFTNTHLELQSGVCRYSVASNTIHTTCSLPKVNITTEDLVFQLRNQTSNEEYGTKMTVGDNKRVYYKSLDERINETIQFEYYSTESDIKISENFIEFSSLKYNAQGYQIKCREGSELKKGWQSGETTYSTYFVASSPDGLNGVARVNFVYINTIDSNAIIVLENTTTHDTLDLFTIDKSKGMNIYFSLNDTKTDKVYRLNATSGLYDLTSVCAKGNATTTITPREVIDNE